MKKFICALLATCFCLILTGCSHEHTAEAMLSLDLEGHWHTCERCGKQLDFAAHAFDEDGNCTVCTAGIFDTEDGLKEARAYDDHGALALLIKFDSEGNIQSDERYLYEYYDDGTVKNEKVYHGLMLTSEDEYLPCEDPQTGGTYHSASIKYTYFSSTRTEFNEIGHIQAIITYDVNGKVASTDRYEYEFDAEGNRTKLSIYTNDELTRVFDDVNHTLYDYDDYGQVGLQRTYIYDDNGVLVKEVIYIYDQLDQENYYTISPDGTQYVCKMVFYDKEGQIEKQFSYDAEGNEIQ